MRLLTGRRLVLIGLVVALGISAGMVRVRKVPGERAVYQKAAERFLAGEPIYCLTDRAAFTYPPFFVLPYLPLANLPDAAAGVAWHFMNFCLIGAVVWLTLRPARPLIDQGAEQGKPRPWVAYVVLAVLSVRFLISPIEWQGHDLIVYFLAMLSITAWAAGTDRAAGAWAGLAAACKATPLLLLPVFLRQRRLVAGAVLILALVAATLLPDLLRRNRDGQLWAQSWYGTFVSKVGVSDAPGVAGAWTKWNPLNQGLSGTTYRLFTPSSECNVCLHPLPSETIKHITFGLQLAVLAVVLLATSPKHLKNMSRQQRAFSVLGMGGVVLCGMLLLSPMSSKPHFCVLLTPLAFCVVDFLYRRRDAVVGVALATCLVFGTPGKDVLGNRLYLFVTSCGSLTLCTAACLLASYRIIVCRARAAARAEAGPQPREGLSQDHAPGHAAELPGPSSRRAA